MSVNPPPGLVWIPKTHKEIGCLAGCELAHGVVKVTDRDAWHKWLKQDAMTKLGLEEE